MTQTQKLQNIIPQLITRAQSSLDGNNRLLKYGSITNLLSELETGFSNLELDTQELSQVIDMSKKQALEEELEAAFNRIEGLYIADTGVAPEFLHKTVESTADFYARVFSELEAGIPESVAAGMESRAIGLTTLQEKYSEWQNIYTAQQSKGDANQRIAEAVDIKECVIGLMRGLNIPPRDIYGILWAV